VRTTLVWIIGLFAALAWVVCFEQIQIVRLRREAARQSARLEDVRGQADRLGQRLLEIEGRQAGADARVAVLSRREVAGSVDASLADRLRRDDEAAAFWRKDERRMVLAKYREVLEQMNLAPDALARLKDLLVARSEAPLDAREAARKEGVADNAPEVAEASDQATADVDREIEQLLGGSDYARFQSLTVQAGYRNEVQTQLGADLADAGASLSSDQTNSLAQIYYEADNAPPATAADVPPADAEAGLTAVDEVVLARSARFLSPDQLKVLRAHRIERHRREATLGSQAEPSKAAAPAAGKGAPDAPAAKAGTGK
jgi:hypothetical protein